MKTVLLLLLAMLAIKTTTTTSAVGQEACSKGYIACLDKCVARPSAAMQETCMNSCQTQNNAVLAGVWRPGPNAVTVKQDAAPANATPAGDAAALASDEQQPKAKKAAKPAKTAKPRDGRSAASSRRAALSTGVRRTSHAGTASQRRARAWRFAQARCYNPVNAPQRARGRTMLRRFFAAPWLRCRLLRALAPRRRSPIRRGR